MKTLTITRPDDWHAHLRDGQYLSRTVPDTAKRFQRAIIMPNLVPPITQIEEALAYRQRIIQHIPNGLDFTPLMTLYLTDNTSSALIKSAAKHSDIYACKLYPAGATTHSASGVTDARKIYPALEAMQKHALPLLVHGEVTDPAVDIFDRETVFIERILIPIIQDFPELKIVLEHITTEDAVQFILAQPANLAATITAHHLRYHRNALFEGGIRPHYYCLPILKREKHQQVLITAATSGSPKFFLGTDSAPHSIDNKETACGCAGIYTAHAAIELYADVFEKVNALDKLEAFASFYGPNFYGLPRNTAKIVLNKQPQQIPAHLDFGDTHLIPLLSGQELAWSLA